MTSVITAVAQAERVRPTLPDADEPGARRSGLRTVVGPHLRRHRARVVGVLGLQVLQAFAALLLPRLNARLIDDGVLTGSVDVILRLGTVMVAVTVIQVVCAVVAVRLAAYVALAIGRDLRAGVFDHVQTLSTNQVAIIGTPTLLTRSTTDPQQVQTVALMVLTTVVAAPVTVVGGLVMAAHEDVRLAGVLVAVLPVLAVVLGVVVARMKPAFRVMARRVDALTEVLREQIGGLRVLRAFGREEHESARFAAANDELREVGVTVGRLNVVVMPSVTLLMNVTSVAVLWWVQRLAGDGMLQVGSLVAYLSYVVQILTSAMLGATMFLYVPRAQASAERIGDLLGTRSDMATAAVVRPAPLDERAAEVELRGVVFRYPGAEEAVLDGVDLVVPAGSTTAVVGSTGAGKTTLLELVMRLSRPTQGQVLVDGVDVRDQAPPDLWKSMGYVQQRAHLFSGTVASNLRYGDPGADDAALWRALEAAQAATVVADLGGLQARVEQGGRNLSGGQRQRLAIARALVRRPRLLLLDDAFSALDARTESALRASLRDELRGTTVLSVTQRVATARHADQVVVLDGGRVVGVGTHDELVSSDAVYREIVRSQLGRAARPS